MNRKRRGFPFRWAFPVGELVLCAILLWPLRSELLAELRPKAPAPPPHPVAIPTIPAGPNEKPGLNIIQVGAVPPQDQRDEQVKQVRLSIPSSLNFPAFFLDFLIYNMVVDRTQSYDEKFRK